MNDGDSTKMDESRDAFLFSHNQDPIFLLDSQGHIKAVNSATSKASGWLAEELIGRAATDFLIAPRKVDWLRLQQQARTGSLRPSEVRFRRKGGSTSIFRVKTIPIISDDTVVEFYCVASDITAHKAFEEQMQFLAFHDSLTQLPNRFLFLSRLNQALEQTDPKNLAVLYLDLNSFKVLNDTLGHLAGDALLVAVAKRLCECIPLGALVARLGGDEFAVLLESGGSRGGATAVAHRILGGFWTPFLIEGQEVIISPSIGIVLGADVTDGEEAIRLADTAMYEAKRRGKSHFQIFDRAMLTRAVQRFRLEVDLRNGLDRGQLQLYYQPVVDLGSGKIQSMEALLRWMHPEQGMILPGAFMALAEETGMIVPIGRWVLEEACRQLSVWQLKLGDRAPKHVNVNISARQLREPGFVSEVSRILKSTSLEPPQVQLEIVESILVEDAEDAIQTLHALKQVGVMLAIDDFGTGYSSLNYLKKLPIDIIKIDRSFLGGLGSDPQDTAIVQAVVSVARALNLIVTGEGVETGEQLLQLQQLPCDRGQGYYFGRPMPGDEAEKLLLGAPIL